VKKKKKLEALIKVSGSQVLGSPLSRQGKKGVGKGNFEKAGEIQRAPWNRRSKSHSVTQESSVVSRSSRSYLTVPFSRGFLKVGTWGRTKESEHLEGKGRTVSRWGEAIKARPGSEVMETREKRKKQDNLRGIRRSQKGEECREQWGRYW